MSKLLEWLCIVTVFVGVWFSLLNNNIILTKSDVHSWLLPLYALMSFGIYSGIVVMYRVFTFNDCSEAATELKMQIKAAREDLSSKGFEFGS